MILEIMQIVLGSLLVLFLPGYLLSRILFPELHIIARIPLAIGLSMVVVMVLGFLLTAFAALGLSAGITATSIWIVLPLITVGLAIIVFIQAKNETNAEYT